MTDLWELLAQSFEPKPEYERAPAQWVHDRAGEDTHAIQDRIMNALVEHRMVAVPSCHGVGKSHIASRVAGWWVDVHGTDPAEVFVVTTAPTAAQVSAVLWRYIGQLHRAANLPGRINRSPFSQWVIDNELVGFGRKPADYEESAFQGIHATWALIIVDEACGILPGLWDQLHSLASNFSARILAIGNPTDPTSHFAEICKPDSDWHVIQVDGLRTPNMTDEGTRDYPLTRSLMQALAIPFSTEQVPAKMAAKLIDPLYVEERIRAYAGFTKTSHLELEPEELADQLVRKTNQSPMFLARIRGVFPTDASTGVIPLGWVQQAVDRWHDWDDRGRPETPGRRVLGVDVAYYGEDETCIAVRQGQVVQSLHTYTKQDTEATADDVLPWLNWPQALAVVDANGVGAGVHDKLRRWRREGKCLGESVPFIAQARSQRRDADVGQFKFQNDRSAAWWRLRELLDPSKGSQIALPDDETLIGDLVAPRYRTHVGGVIVVESKDEIKKRLKRSTDRADAVIQSFWVDGLPADHTDGVDLQNKGGTLMYEGYSPVSFDEMFGGR